MMRIRDSLASMPTLFRLRLATLCVLSSALWLLVALSAAPAQKLPLLVVQQPVDAPTQIAQVTEALYGANGSTIATASTEEIETSSGEVELDSESDIESDAESDGESDADSDGEDGLLMRRLPQQSGSTDGLFEDGVSDGNESDDNASEDDQDDTDGSDDDFLVINTTLMNGSYELDFSWRQGCTYDDYADMWACSDGFAPLCSNMSSDTPATLALDSATSHLGTLAHVLATIPAATAFTGVSALHLFIGALCYPRTSGSKLATIFNHGGFQVASILTATLLAICGWAASLAGIAVLSGTEVIVATAQAPPEVRLGGGWAMLTVICALLIAAVVLAWQVYVRQAREELFVEMGINRTFKIRGAPSALYASDAEKAREARLSTIEEETVDHDDAFRIEDGDHKDRMFMDAEESA